MKNRAFLPLIEQIIMIAVFAIVATVCIACFSSARQISVKTELTDNAVILAQNTAETIKNKGLQPERSTVYYNKDLLPDASGEYAVKIEPIIENDPFLCGATVSVMHKNETLFELTVHWQEGLNHETN